jgi:transposase
MANRRIEVHQYREVLYRIRQGETLRAIDRAKLMSRRKSAKLVEMAQPLGWLDPSVELPDNATIAKALLDHKEQSKVGPVGRRTSLGPEHQALIRQWVECGVNAVVIHKNLVKDYGVNCHYSSIRRLARKIKENTPQLKPTVKLDFEHGEAAQVDFGAGPFMSDPVTGKPKRVWFFVMTLCASRHQYLEFVWDQTVATWLRCHQRAFEFFGGRPARLIIDNPKCAITRAVRDDPDVQRAYGELAQGYGFLIDPCAPADPQKKGRVESGVKYVKNNFLPTRQFRDLADMNAQATDWVMNTAGQRIHGSTFAKPLDLFQIEKAHLKALPPRRPDIFWYARAKVHNDCHIQFQRCFYSVPYRLIGYTVLLRISAATLDVLYEEQMVVNHILATKPGTKRTVEDHMPEPYLAWRMRAPQWCVSQAEEIGPYCHALIRNIMGDKVVHRLRTVQGLLRLRDRYSDRQIELACQRCGILDMITAKGLTRIIEQMEQEIKAGLVLDSGADDTSTPAYEGRGVHARDSRALMTQ